METTMTTLHMWKMYIIVCPHCLPTVPFQQFQVLLTPFSGRFSSFPHGTCSLSVSHQYLALDGIYHLLWAAFPNNSTQRKRIVRSVLQAKTGVSPSMLPSSKGLNPQNTADNSFNRLQLAIPNWYRDFKLELFPLHSPLLGESLLVSFPPLSYMLKFSG